MRMDAQWSGAHVPGPTVPLFCWGPGDSLIVTSGDMERPAHAPARGADPMPRMPVGGTEVQEYRCMLMLACGLWRHRRYVQKPFQLFYAEAQNVWSESIRETIRIGMDESRIQERRDLLCDETLQYKVTVRPLCHCGCRGRVAHFLLVHSAWHTAGMQA